VSTVLHSGTIEVSRTLLETAGYGLSPKVEPGPHFDVANYGLDFVSPMKSLVVVVVVGVVVHRMCPEYHLGI